MSAVTNREVRARAADTVRYQFGRVVLLTLTAIGLPILLYLAGCWASMLGTASSAISALANYGANTYTDTILASSLLAALTDIGVFAVLAIVVSLLLQVGYARGLQKLGNGEAVKASVLLPHWKHILGCLGLPLWVGVKTLAWGVPGFLVQTLGALLGDGGAGTFVSILGDILYYALVIPASLRYALAIHAFADNPEVGVFDAVETSKAMMRYRKWQLFCLTLPYALIIIAVWVGYIVFVALGAAWASTALGAWLIVVLLLAAIATTAYMGMKSAVAVACYYNAHKE